MTRGGIFLWVAIFSSAVLSFMLISCATPTTMDPTIIARTIAEQLELSQAAENLNERRIIFFATELKKGDIVTELDPTSDETSESFTVPVDGFLFVVDLEPLSRFAHPVIYVFTDRFGNIIDLTKNFQTPDWLPAVNGVEVLTGNIYNPTFNKIAWTNFNLATVGSITFGEIVNRMEVLCGAVVVNGNDPTRLPDSGMSIDFTNVGQFFRSFYDDFRVRRLEYPHNTYQHLQNAVDDLHAQSMEFITIYIVTHGSVNRLVMGSQRMNPTQLRDLILSYPNIKFALIIDACYSGSFIDDLWTSIPNLVVITTATDESHPSYGDLDYPNDPDTEDVGGEWSSGFLKGLLQNTALGPWLNVEIQADAAGVKPEQVLYRRAFQVAWDNDCARINGLSVPQYRGQYAP